MIIGLTGGIGSGKSTVASMLEKQGYKIIDADAVSKEVTSTDSVAKKLLTDYFGETILNPDGSINRSKLGNIVFNDSEKLAVLNSIVTKRIIEISKERFSDNCVYDAPTLLENGLQNIVDIVILVTADDDIRMKRVMKRSNYSEDHIKRIMAVQMPENEKIALSDYVIYNNGSLEELELQVTETMNCVKMNR